MTDLDFEFVGVTVPVAIDCHSQRVPLGMTAPQYQQFLQTLEVALSADGLDDADVRLQGSAGQFFSSPAKRLPKDKGELLNVFMDEFGRRWEAEEGDRIFAAYKKQWPKDSPDQRPFDSLYRLGVAKHPSDVDVQISSDAALAVVRTDLREHGGVDPGSVTMADVKYSFLQKALTDFLFLYVQQWAERWRRHLNRDVNVVFFGRSGPPSNGKLFSSHFRDTDWIVRAAPEWSHL
ncbi:hypothetical protein [Curtobacterium sp. VKM Ac-1395]|uniref:hypothetical protein n=1 Tax=Curtobacterium sp. VKM Ac-1395 TaxID=2783815 RepID=UPI00188AD402|nr:hypothetical protein [Curtobacterium sp. VKM Ac-1395]MBF4592014.1 hypothetical protein [Curtobacterium sp. VKM Ac-1395]